MEATFVLGNMVWNAGLFAAAIWLVKRWVSGVDISLKDIHTEVKTANGRTSQIESAVRVRDAICEERHGEK